MSLKTNKQTKKHRNVLACDFATYIGASLVAQRVKHLPAMQESWVLSLVREDPLEKEMATHCSILAWRILWTEEPGGLQSWGCKESDTTERLHFHIVKPQIGLMWLQACIFT